MKGRVCTWKVSTDTAECTEKFYQRNPGNEMESNFNELLNEKFIFLIKASIRLAIKKNLIKFNLIIPP
jgi:hypothetical protein